MIFRRFLSLVLITTITVSGAAFAVEFTQISNYPSPAPGSWFIVGAGTPDGRALLWDGDAIYLQDAVGVDAFAQLPGATGYVGDPAFITLSPDGNTALLGSGWNGGNKIYQFSIDDPKPYSPAADVVTMDHYGAAFLTRDLVAIDGAAWGSPAEISVISLSAKSRAPRLVLSGPPAEAKDTVITKPEGSYSATLALNRKGTLLYVMDGNTRELKGFEVADLIDAYNSAAMLDWENDGEAIGLPGAFFGAGVAGETPDGCLLIGGSEYFDGPGGIHVVDAQLGVLVSDVLDPAGTGAYTRMFYISAANIAIIEQSGYVYTSSGDWPPAMPAADGAGLTLLMAVIIGLSALALRRRMQRA